MGRFTAINTIDPLHPSPLGVPDWRQMELHSKLDRRTPRRAEIDGKNFSQLLQGWKKLSHNLEELRF
jgi:hypothetical protein